MNSSHNIRPNLKGKTSGVHAISHSAVQRLEDTCLSSGGFVGAGPKILRSAQETMALVARQRDRYAAVVNFALCVSVCA